MAQLDDPIRRPERRRAPLRALPGGVDPTTADPAQVVLLLMKERPFGDHAGYELHQRLRSLGVSLEEPVFNRMLTGLLDAHRIHRTKHGLYRLGSGGAPVRRTPFDAELARRRAADQL